MGEYDCRKKFDAISRIEGLRTLIALLLRKNPYQADTNCYLARSLLHDNLLKLRCLSLSHSYNINELLDSLESLFIRDIWISLMRTSIQIQVQVKTPIKESLQGLGGPMIKILQLKFQLGLGPGYPHHSLTLKSRDYLVGHASCTICLAAIMLFIFT